MNLKSISKEEFHNLNVYVEPSLSFIAEEIDWYADSYYSILGVILKDRMDNDFTYIILTADENEIFRAVGVEASISSLDLARAKLISELNSSIAKGRFEKWLYRDEESIVATSPEITVTSPTANATKSEEITSKKKQVTSAIVIDINIEIKKYLKKHPEKLHDLSGRRFEELIASIMQDLGFSVELTKATRDGGVDIIARIKNAVTDFLAYVECKKYSAENKIGVGIVRGVIGVHTLKRPSKSIIVTTSDFSKDAVNMAKEMNHQIELVNYEGIKLWLDETY